MICYRATNTKNRKVYIGKTTRSLHHAKARHINRARLGIQTRFYAAIRKHGEDAFAWEIIYQGSSDADIQAAERRLIAEHRSQDRRFGYNATPGGDGGAGKVLTDEHKERLRDVFSGAGNPMFGRFGTDHPGFGHKKTTEGLANIAKAHRGKQVSEETRAKQSAARLALFNTPEAIAQREQREYVEAEERAARERVRAEMREAGAFRGEHGRASKLTDAQRVVICSRRAAGESYKSISLDYPVGLTGVRAVVTDWGPRNGYPFAAVIAKRRTKLSALQKTEACRRFAAGESYLDLAAEFEVGDTTMFEVVRTWGPANGYPYPPQ